MGAKLYGDWGVAIKIMDTMVDKYAKARKEATLEEAHYLRKLLVQGVTQGAPAGKTFKPLSKTTLAVRALKGTGGTKPMLNNADYRNAIIVKESGGLVFVGILRSAKGKGGASVANIAEIAEYGSKPIVIQVTPKMRKLLMLAFRRAGIAESGGPHGGGGGGIPIIVVQIPARPVFGPVFEAYCSDKAQVAKRWMGRLAKRMGGDFGYT